MIALDVRPRQIARIDDEQLRLLLMLLLKRLDGADVLQVALRDVVIVEPRAALKGVLQVFA